MLGRCARPCGPLKLYTHQLVRPASTASAIQRGVGRFTKKVQRRDAKDDYVIPEPRKRSQNVFHGHRSYRDDSEPRNGARNVFPGNRSYQDDSERRSGPRNVFPGNRSYRDDERPWLSMRRSPEISGQNARNAEVLSRFPSKRGLAQRGRANPEVKTQDRPRSVAFQQEKEDSDQDHMPISVPHTTAASEFLYGRSAVEAALRAHRRKLYKLYTFNPGTTPDVSIDTHTRDSIFALARRRSVEVVKLRSDRLLQKISGGRPTNGLVLEASPLPFLKCTSLQAVDRQSSTFEIARSTQSQEERDINGNETEVQYDAHGKRYPLLLFLDGILDPGNLGGILRSAFFLGADAVILSSHGSPITAAALKAASGAAETLPIIVTRATGHFIRTSQSNGWKFYAATAPLEGREGVTKPTYTLETLGYPLAKHPCVVVLGNEGAGLWEDVEEKTDYYVSINGRRSGQDGVDSLNVSVSAALLTQAFLRASPYQTPKNRLWKDDAT